MEVFKGYQHFSPVNRQTVVTIGNFDGVHLGHRQIIETALRLSQSHQGEMVAYTFRPHPQMALRPDVQVQLLTTYDEKLEILGRIGVKYVIEEPFSREFSTTQPEQFFTDILLRKLHARSIVVGYDFSFGNKRSGHLNMLDSWCKDAGVELVVVPPHRVSDEVVSSSRIRQHLLQGEIEAANRLMGREFFYRSVVLKGDGRGRKIGFPTANLKPENKLLLPHGVYATWAWVGGKRYASVTNIGVRPTFGGLPVVVETHFMDQDIDLYGNTIEVGFVRKLREERKFPGIEELKAQISHDTGEARKALTEAES